MTRGLVSTLCILSSILGALTLLSSPLWAQDTLGLYHYPAWMPHIALKGHFSDTWWLFKYAIFGLGNYTSVKMSVKT